MKNTYTDMNTAIYGAYPQRGKEWIQLAQKLNDTRKDAKKLALYEKELAAQLQLLSRNESSRGGNYLFEKRERQGNVNYAIIPQLKRVDLDRYRKDPVTSWSLKEIN